ncbi:MAG: DUF4980 domain-containing protein [Alloprevotella sp.]
MRTLKSKLVALLMLATLTPAPVAFAEGGVEINHLGVNNTLVRVTGSAKYLLIPVQESAEEARVKVLVDGELAKNLNIRLAMNRVDYFVPFCLTPYEGHHVLLNVVTAQGRSTLREAKDNACWKDMRLSDTFDTANREKYRPAFHHTPLYGWMNDPNGMFYKDGTWHLYYQYNPYGSKWQNLSWGHSTSKDLIVWEHQTVALDVDGLGHVFSGSAVVDTAGTAGFGKDAVVALYTSCDASQIQSMAYSNDGGTTFRRYPGNPVLTLESEARDPNMFWDEKAGQWVLTLAHALEREFLFFTSPDLKTWTLQSAFGKGEGAQEGVWECPDLFKLKVEGSDEEKWVLICNLNPGGPFGGSATQYFIGDFDGKTFKSDTDASGHIPTKWMDFGKDHYATVSWAHAPQNRRTVIGWMSNWQYAAEVPTTQYRSANTLPRDVSLFRAPDGELYLASAPAAELTALRGALVCKAGKATVGKKSRTFELPAANGGICEILLDIDARKADSVSINIANKAGERVVLTYNPAAHTLAFDRRASGLKDFSQDFPAVTVAPTFENSRKTALRIFIDRSSIEVFGNNGHFVATNLVFPTQPYSTLSVTSHGGSSKISNLGIISIKEH